jgi:two-component system OmpR family sensor kinase
MSSIRTRLTFRFGAVMLATMFVFAMAVYWARRSGVIREAADEAVSHGDLALGILRTMQRASLQGVVVRTDSLIGSRLNPQVGRVLDAIPGFLIVFDENGRRLYSSPAVNALSVASGNLADLAQRDVDEFDRVLDSVRQSTLVAVATLRNDRILLLQRHSPDSLMTGSLVVAGVSLERFDTSQREVLGSTLLILPFILVASVGGAWVIAGRALPPIDLITAEVAAITDGRSLHRRLAVEASGDELARLGTTLNGMIGRLEQSFGALRRFTADASHELKTPLAVLRADIERAMHASSQSTEQLVALEEALEQTTRMADLVDSLLTLARSDEGRFDLHRELIHLEPLAREVLETALILG